MTSQPNGPEIRKCSLRPGRASRGCISNEGGPRALHQMQTRGLITPGEVLDLGTGQRTHWGRWRVNQDRNKAGSWGSPSGGASLDTVAKKGCGEQGKERSLLSPWGHGVGGRDRSGQGRIPGHVLLRGRRPLQGQGLTATGPRKRFHFNATTPVLLALCR